MEEAEYNKWINEQKPWLANNRDYLEKVPANLREKALRIIGSEGSATNASAANSGSEENPLAVPVNPDLVTTKANASIR